MLGFEQLMTGCQTASLHWGPFYQGPLLQCTLHRTGHSTRKGHRPIFFLFLTRLVLSELKLCEFHCIAHYRIRKRLAEGAGSKRGSYFSQRV